MSTARHQDYLTSRRAQRLATALAGLGRVDEGSSPASPTSITHSGGWGACVTALSPVSEHVVGVGVDAEPLRDASARAARFFLDSDEQAWLADAQASIRAAEQVRMWTIKEAVFKADPDNAEHILMDYRLPVPEAHAGVVRRHATGGNRAAPTFGYIHSTVLGFHLSVAVALRRSTQEIEPSPRRNESVQLITFDAVAERISAVLSVPVERLTPESTLADLAADSFLLVEMVVDLQEEFDSIFTQAELRRVTKLSELVSLLQTNAHEGPVAAADPSDGFGH
ncbi:MAG TPA: 4'-phosphopantetheinyl transferase superfamily protein [Jatrophihabitans sp.]